MAPETRERIRKLYGIDKPIWINSAQFEETGDFSDLFDSQFFHYVKNLLQGNLGESFRQKKPVSELIGNRIGPTVLLIFAGEITGIIFGTILGILAAWKRGTAIDTSALIVSLAAWA
ncbi:unnamed protein product, partial [marine sediment metagenome]